jgi:hypothetical protein
MTLLITFSQVREIMMQSGLRRREAEALLQRQLPPPVQHHLHARRLWLRQTVLDFCADLQKSGSALGEGRVRCGSPNVNPAPSDVRTLRTSLRH